MRLCGAVRLLVFLPGLGLFLGSSPVVLAPPRTSYPLNSPGRPLARFTEAQNTTTLLLSDDGSTLYVGARDAVLSLDVSQPGVITARKKVEWKPSEEEIWRCSAKGRYKAECGNFVKVLQAINSTHLYACGSFAYNPQDTLIDAETLSMVRTPLATGKRCPYSPSQRNTAITIDGELFSGTTTDFMGNRPAIARHFSRGGRPDVTLDTSIRLLNEPTFVSSWFDRAEGKVLFFLTEVAKEHSFVEELTMPRVAQVCKSDGGGAGTLVRRWTSFAKAPLICQTARELPFNVLQDMTTLRPAGGDDGTATADTLFYGVFTSQWSIGHGSSAVCVFKMRDIRAAFDGSYKKEDMLTRQWNPAGRKHDLGKCGLGNASGEVLEEVKKTFLTSDSVKQAQGGPLLVSTSQRYSRLVAERTRAADGTTYTMLFLLSENGFLHKVVLSEQGPRVIEEVQVFQRPQLLKLHPSLNLLLSSSKGVVYVGSSEGVTAVPLSSCPSYQSCAQCVLARDPLCGWDHNGSVCAQVTAQHGPSDTSMGQDVENGNVTKVCVSAKAAPPPEERRACLMDVVTLPCPKPSNLATLRWIAPGSAPQRLLLLQRPDGGSSLSFPLTADTLGAYACVSEEGGYEDRVASYSVKLRDLPPCGVQAPPMAPRAVQAPPMATPAVQAPPMATPATEPLKDDDGGIVSANPAAAASVKRKAVATDTSATTTVPTATQTSASAETSEAVAFLRATDAVPRERSEQGRPTDLLAAATTAATTTAATTTTADELHRPDEPTTTERRGRSDTVAVVPTSADAPEKRRPAAGQGRRRVASGSDPPTAVRGELHRSTQTIPRNNVHGGPNTVLPPAATEDFIYFSDDTVRRYTEDGGGLAPLDAPDEEAELRVTKREGRRSHFNQLVVVSVLLAVCVGVLLVGLVHRGHQSRHHHLVAARSEKGGGGGGGGGGGPGGEAPGSPESVPALSEEDSPPEVKIQAHSHLVPSIYPCIPH